MGLPTLLLLFVIAVLPFIQCTTPEYFEQQPWGMGGDQLGSGIYPTAGQGQGLNPIYGSSSGRIWCTCRRRCRYREWTMGYTCVLPFYPRYWRTCCKYLRNYQTSSLYGGNGGSTYPGSTYPQTYPGSMYPQMSYPTYSPYGMGGGSLPPKGA